MNIQSRKLSLIEWLTSLDDVNTIDQIENLQHRKKAKKELKPMSLNEYANMIKESEQDINEGRVYAHEEVVKYMRKKR